VLIVALNRTLSFGFSIGTKTSIIKKLFVFSRSSIESGSGARGVKNSRGPVLPVGPLGN